MQTTRILKFDTLALAAFTVAFSLTEFVLRLTIAPSAGPSSAGAWAAGALGGEAGQSVLIAPMFSLLARIVGFICPDNIVATALNDVTLFGYALFAGFIGLTFYTVLRRREVWAYPMLAAFGGALVGVSRLGWASAIIVNSAPWALAFIGCGWWLLNSASDSRDVSGGTRKYLLAAFCFGLAMSFHLASILVLPAMVAWAVPDLRRLPGRTLLWMVLAGLIPLLAYPFGPGQPIFFTHGLFPGSPGIAEANGLRFSGWAILWSMTPFALPFTLWGVIRAWITSARVRLPLLLFAGCLLLGSFAPREFGQFTGLLAAIGVAIGAVFGLVDLFARLPSGYAILLWLLFPALWLGHGLILDRSGGMVWETHVNNAIRTVRLNSLVLCVDDQLINAPYAYLRRAKSVRPDIMLINPVHLFEPAYLERIESEYPERLEPVRDRFDSLKAKVADPGTDPYIRRNALTVFVADLIREEVRRDGVLVSPGYTPPTPEFELIPEGLFVRVWNRKSEDEKPLPFHFVGLNMNDIRFKENISTLQQRMVATYPMMFTSRGSWLLRNRFTAEGMEYIRWALKIDPTYMPAKILARDYGIKGPPQYLGK